MPYHLLPVLAPTNNARAACGNPMLVGTDSPDGLSPLMDFRRLRWRVSGVYGLLRSIRLLLFAQFYAVDSEVTARSGRIRDVDELQCGHLLMQRQRAAALDELSVGHAAERNGGETVQLAVCLNVVVVVCLDRKSVV